VGPLNWKNEYKEIAGQLVCGVSIFDPEAGWVTKWDVGTESNFEAEKGHFSDAFKIVARQSLFHPRLKLNQTPRRCLYC
jgi:hypothetical protein